MAYKKDIIPSRLAWHETLELHELVAFQSFGLMRLKKSLRKIPDPALQALYRQSIQAVENNIRQLLPFFEAAPMVRADEAMPSERGFYAGDLLGLAKTTVRNYAIAITETATPAVREVLSRHLLAAVQWHALVFNYMYERGLYPAYDLNQLLANDVRNAQRALTMPY